MFQSVQKCVSFYFISLGSLMMAYSFYMSKMMFSLYIEWDLFSLGSISLSFPIVLDWVSISFSGTVLVVSGMVFFYSIYYMGSFKIEGFVILVFLFVSSMNLLIFIPNVIVMLLGWDGLGVVSFLLVIYYQSDSALSSGLITFFINRFGDVLILSAIGFLIMEGHWKMEFYFSSDWCFILLILGAMTKSAQFPFCSWLPAAMAAPTPVSSLVHSSTLVTAGVYILCRLSLVSSSSLFCNFLFLMGGVTSLGAGLGGLVEPDVKKVVALSTMSQLGIMIMSVSSGFPYLCMFHLFCHAFFKSLLFLCVGAAIKASGDQSFYKLGLFWKCLPYSSSMLCIANLSLCGFPFLSGFYSKDLIIESVLDKSLFFVIVMIASCFFTICYSFRILINVLWSSKMLCTTEFYQEGIYVKFPLACLGALSSLMGWLWQSCCCDLNIMFFLSDYMKLTPVFVLFSGVTFIFLISTTSLENLLGSKLNFLNSIFFLDFLWSESFLPFKALSFQFYSCIDMGWLESLSYSSAWEFLKKSSFLMKWLYSLGPTSFFFISLVFFLGCIL